MKMSIRALKQGFRAPALAIFLDGSNDGKVYTAEPLKMREVTQYETDGDAACVIQPTEAQQLMDDLWACGLRPTEGQGSAGQLAAVQKHLTDMQHMVERLLIRYVDK